MTEHYQPEMGQACFGQPWGAYAVPRWVDSMFDGIYSEVRRVYWNIKQESYHDYIDADLGAVHIRGYYWGEDEDHDPRNFWIDGIKQAICWYKHPGRGMSSSFELDRDAWIAWHDAVMAELRRVDKEHFDKIARDAESEDASHG